MTNNKKHLYIIGAGFAGQTIADDIKRKKIFGTVSAFLDDDKKLIGTKIDDIPVIGPIENVASALRCSEQDEAIIAIPSAPTERIKKIYETLKNIGFSHIKILPGGFHQVRNIFIDGVGDIHLHGLPDDAGQRFRVRHRLYEIQGIFMMPVPHQGYLAGSIRIAHGQFD